MKLRSVAPVTVTMVLSAFVVGSAQAQTASDAYDDALGVKAGFLGLGVEYGHRFSERLALRVGINGSGTSFDEVESGIQYDFDLDFDSILVGVDVHPAKGAFRLSFGMLQNDSSLSALGVGTGTYTIGDTVYTGDEVGTLRGSVTFEGSAPFASLGWDWRQNNRVGLALDIGIVDQGAPRVGLSADGLLASDPSFQLDLEAERAELQESLDDLDLYPYAAFGFVFRF